MLAADGFLQEGLVNVVQNVDHGAVGNSLDLIQNLLVPLLRHNPLRRIPVAVTEAKQLTENHLQLQLCTPTEILGKGESNAVAVVDLGKHEAVGRIYQMAAQHAREAVAGQHGAFAGAAAGDHIVRSTAVE